MYVSVMKGRLEEELLAEGQEILDPKFHCELNFIERFWCVAKFYARENCRLGLEQSAKEFTRHLT